MEGWAGSPTSLWPQLPHQSWGREGEAAPWGAWRMEVTEARAWRLAPATSLSLLSTSQLPQTRSTTESAEKRTAAAGSRTQAGRQHAVQQSECPPFPPPGPLLHLTNTHHRPSGPRRMCAAPRRSPVPQARCPGFWPTTRLPPGCRERPGTCPGDTQTAEHTGMGGGAGWRYPALLRVTAARGLMSRPRPRTQ